MMFVTFRRSGIPSARFVLLKAFDESGYTFYTNSESRKGREIVSTLSLFYIMFILLESAMGAMCQHLLIHYNII